MHVFGVGLMALGAVGLLYLAGHVVWQEVRRLGYLNRLDEWASEVDRWR